MKRLKMTDWALAELLKGNARVIGSRVPDSAQLRSIDPTEGGAWAYFESPDFEDVDNARPTPEIEAPLCATTRASERWRSMTSTAMITQGPVQARLMSRDCVLPFEADAPEAPIVARLPDVIADACKPGPPIVADFGAEDFESVDDLTIAAEARQDLDDLDAARVIVKVAIAAATVILAITGFLAGLHYLGAAVTTFSRPR